MNRFVYLDNNATTKCDESVVDAMLPYLKEHYGNPSSLYSFGKDVKQKINQVRKNVAKLIGAESSEIIFTSCASESNATAILSTISSNSSKRHIITSSVEHSSILETMHFLEKQGYRITYLPVDKNGKLDLKDLEQAICDDTILISVMMANNELGNIYPIKEIGEIAKKHNILFHCDAVQAVGKIKIDVKEMNIDMLSMSGHKFHAPKGIGVLYTNSKLNPLIFGHQEKNRRGGTENVAGIIGLGKAVEQLLDDDFQNNTKIKYLRDMLEEKVANSIQDIKIYGDLENRLDNTSSIAFRDVDSQELMFMLESKGIVVSTGSACNSESSEPSHVLSACRADLEDYSPIRISLSKYTTNEDVEIFVRELKEIIAKLRKN